MCFQLRDALRVGNLVFSRQLFSSTSSPDDAVRTLEDELRNFCILVEPPRTPFGKGKCRPARAAFLFGRLLSVARRLKRVLTVKKTYSGKVGGRNDDLVITLQLAIAGIRCESLCPRQLRARP